MADKQRRGDARTSAAVTDRCGMWRFADAKKYRNAKPGALPSKVTDGGKGVPRPLGVIRVGKGDDMPASAAGDGCDRRSALRIRGREDPDLVIDVGRPAGGQVFPHLKSAQDNSGYWPLTSSSSTKAAHPDILPAGTRVPRSLPGG